MSKNLTEITDDIIKKAQENSRFIYDNVIETTKSLSQIESAIVKKMVTASDVAKNPTKFHAGSVGEVKTMAGYETDALAFAGDITTAKSLTEYYYPDEDTIIIIERS